MRKRAVKFITVFFLSLVLVVACPLFGFQSEAAGTLSFYPFPESRTVSSSWGAAGVDNSVTLSFPSMVQTDGSLGMYGFFVSFSPRFEPADSDCFYYIDNVRIVIGGCTYDASYQDNGFYLVQGQFEYDASSNPHCSILIDLHRIVSSTLSSYTLNSTISNSASYGGNINALNDGRLDIPYYQILLNEKSGGGYSGYAKSPSATTLKFDAPDYYLSGVTSSSTGYVTTSGHTENNAALLSGGTFYLGMDKGSSNVIYLGSSTRSTLQQMAAQQHKDSQDQLQESQKQTDAMTKFDGKADMDKNSSDLNSSLTDFDSVQQSIFESSSTAINNFDFENLFSFSLNISSAIGVWNSLMISIVASMGDFALIYTLSMGLVFISIIVGIWRYFVK